MAAWVPRAVGLCTAALVLALGAQHDGASPHVGEAVLPPELAGYSHLTGSVSGSPPGAAVALYQHGFGVEFLDFPQAVVLGAGGDVYRRVDAAEARAGPETQGDPAPMLLSPDGTTVAVGDHDVDRPDVVLVDLVTGATTRHSLPAGRSVVPVAWSSDGRRLAHLLSPEPTNPYSGEPILGQVGLLDIHDGSTVLLQDIGQVSAAAFSPDGLELALQLPGDRRRNALRGGSCQRLPAYGRGRGRPCWSVRLVSGRTAARHDDSRALARTARGSGARHGDGARVRRPGGSRRRLAPTPPASAFPAGPRARLVWLGRGPDAAHRPWRGCVLRLRRVPAQQPSRSTEGSPARSCGSPACRASASADSSWPAPSSTTFGSLPRSRSTVVGGLCGCAEQWRSFSASSRSAQRGRPCAGRDLPDEPEGRPVRDQHALAGLIRVFRAPSPPMARLDVRWPPARRVPSRLPAGVRPI